jgi:hypothetical protein
MNTRNTTLIVFAVIAAFGLVMATVAVLPIMQQANAALRVEKNCHNAGHPPPCQPLRAKP